MLLLLKGISKVMHALEISSAFSFRGFSPEKTFHTIVSIIMFLISNTVQSILSDISSFDPEDLSTHFVQIHTIFATLKNEPKTIFIPIRAREAEKTLSLFLAYITRTPKATLIKLGRLTFIYFLVFQGDRSNEVKFMATFSRGVRRTSYQARETKFLKFQHFVRAQTLGYHSDVIFEDI